MLLLYYMDAEEFLSEKIFEDAMAFVGLERQKKVNRLQRKEAKCCSLAAGVLLLFCLHELGLENLWEEITIGKNGKPYLPNCQIFFSLSHSGKYAICAVSDKPIGCDIEKKREVVPIQTRKIFSPSEKLYFDNLNEEEKKDFFFRLWTWKESFVKWIGKGIGFPLAGISCIHNDEFITTLNYEDKELHLKEFSLEGYCIHICAENREFPKEILQMKWKK